MTAKILTDVADSMTESKAKAHESMMDRLEDLDLLAIAKSRQDEPSISVDINDL